MAVVRAAVLFVGVAMLSAAAIVAVTGTAIGGALWLAAVGAALVVGILFERSRYKPAMPGHPGPGWVATDERFVDPQSGELVTVYYQRSTGERRYVSR